MKWPFDKKSIKICRKRFEINKIKYFLEQKFIKLFRIIIYDQDGPRVIRTVDVY